PIASPVASLTPSSTPFPSTTLFRSHSPVLDRDCPAGVIYRRPGAYIPHFEHRYFRLPEHHAWVLAFGVFYYPVARGIQDRRHGAVHNVIGPQGGRLVHLY